MCLNTVWSKEKMEHYLRDKDDEIICYKVVQIRKVPYGNRDRIFPPSVSGWWRYNKINDTPRGPVSRGNWSNVTYRLAYHLYKTKKGCEGWMFIAERRILKCKVRKKDIVAIGRQENYMTIVTTRFEIMNGDEWFGD